MGSLIIMNRRLGMLSKILRFFGVFIGLFPVQSVFAKSGGVDYSWGADALALMHDYVVTMMLYVLYLAYAVAAIVAVIAGFQIYIKMNVGEEGVTKEILFLVGACIFMISASIVFPSFFGYRI